MSMKKWDWILFAGAVCIAILMLMLFSYGREDGAYVIVSVNGSETARYALSEEMTEDIQGMKNGHVQLVIHDGEADVTEASCPDKLCVHQAKISKSGEMIVCLPNRIVISIAGDRSTMDLDAVTN
ncbi:MAG: NusG domain II-containing protein [bacterium]|nr:NusG domain II-containing protein [bacterium]